MRIWGATMVRNEADIVEVFARHNLALLDGMVVVDHGSTDRTRAVLTALVNEGLPLVILEHGGPAYAQKEVMTLAVRQAFAVSGADFVFALDADEFVHAPGRPRLESALAKIAPGGHGLLHSRNYVPHFAASATDIVALIAGARRRRGQSQAFGKVVVAKHFATMPRALLAHGNHAVMPWLDATTAELEPHVLLDPYDVAIAHVPIRSAAQYILKIVVNRLGRIAAGRDLTEAKVRLWAYDYICADQPLDAAFLRRMAYNFGIPRDTWTAPVDDELVPDPFLVPLTLRYTPPGEPLPLPLVLGAVEQLARLEARARRATPVAATA